MPIGKIEADYKFDLGAPICFSVTPTCTTVGTGLLDAKGSMEEHGSNTVDSCIDGNAGVYKKSESIEAVTVSSHDGGVLKAGNNARIFAQVWVFDELDRVDFYYSTSPGKNTVWQHISTATPSNTGLVTVESDLFAVQGTYVQAVRVVLRWQGEVGSASPCPTGTDPPFAQYNQDSYMDVDDLGFVVDIQHLSLSTNSTLDFASPGQVDGSRPEKDLVFDCTGYEKLRCDIAENHCLWKNGDCHSLE